MADVQLEHGHLRIANALDEAMTVAPFTGTQQKIVRCLVRLTFGWRQITVRMSRPEIADRCGMKPVGGFLRAFDELIRAGVIVESERPFGRTPGAYAINKDFEHWGPFSVAAARLESLFRQRPSTADRPTLQGQSSSNGQQTPQGHSSNGPRQTPQGHLSGSSDTLPGHRDIPSEVGHPDPIGSVKSPEVVESQQVRPSERQERQERQGIRARTRARGPHALCAKIRTLITIDGPSRFIRRTEVEALGSDVLAAYTAVGGAERFLDSSPQNLKWLSADFAKALEEIRADASEPDHAGVAAGDSPS